MDFLKKNTQQWHEIKDCVDVLVNRSKDANDKKIAFNSLMAKVRPYLRDGILLDFCNLCAHPSRDRGLCVDHLERFYRYLKFHMEYGNNRKELNTMDMPGYFKQYLMDQLKSDLIQEKRVKKALNLKIKDLEMIIKNHIKCDDDRCYVDGNESQVSGIIMFLANKFKLGDPYCSTKFIENLNLFLTTQGFTKKIDIRFFEDELTILLLLALHDKQYFSKENDFPDTHAYIRSIYNIEHQEFYLAVYLHIACDKTITNKSVTIAIPMIQTKLISSEWFDESLLTVATTGSCNHPDYRSFQPLRLDSKFHFVACDAFLYDMAYHRGICVSAKYGDDERGNGSIPYKMRGQPA